MNYHMRKINMNTSATYAVCCQITISWIKGTRHLLVRRDLLYQAAKKPELRLHGLFILMQTYIF